MLCQALHDDKVDDAESSHTLGGLASKAIITQDFDVADQK